MNESVEFEINAVEFSDLLKAPEDVEAIGNLQQNWAISAASAIVRMHSAEQVFFLVDQLREEKVLLKIARGRDGKLHPRAWANGRWTDHLMGLRPLGSVPRID